MSEEIKDTNEAVENNAPEVEETVEAVEETVEENNPEEEKLKRLNRLNPNGKNRLFKSVVLPKLLKAVKN